ncbi:MAG: Maf family protein, partial [Phycisphaerales bacterium]|nr:Maf family protein [Phycisphaerales bacterium]
MHAVAPSKPDHRRFPLVILASSSPRRRALFEDAGIPHAVHPSGVDDGLLHSGRVHPQQWVGSLAYYKASSTAQTLDPVTRAGSVVLGADTVCVQDDRIIGQPVDRADAGRIIRTMMGRTHDVLTGVALIDPETGHREIFVDRSVVTVGELTEEQI